MNILEGEHILIRALEPKDIEALFEWENDTDVWRVSNTVAPLSRKTLEAFIENQKYDPFDTKQIRLIIESKHDHNAIGSIDLIDIDLFNSRACIGILIYGKAQGLGYATEALEITKRYCFEVLALRQIYCNIAADNDRSLTLFKHCGFEVSGVKKEWRRSFNGWIDEHFLQCINKINT